MKVDARSLGRRDERVSRGSLRNQVTIRILSAIFEGRFRSDERLVVQRLAEAYDVSPTPVREALLELGPLGVVELLPNRGAVVLPFGSQQVREIGQVRRILESEATRCACGRINLSLLHRLREAIAALSTRPADERRDQDARALDTSLHELIAQSCGSSRLSAEIFRYLTLFRALRDVSHLRDAATNYSRSDDVPEHLDVLDHLIALKPEVAAAAMDHHIRSATETIANVLFTT